MLICLWYFIFLFGLTSCAVMPGMQNPDISQMRQVAPSAKAINPIVIPITPELIKDQHISTYVYRVAAADILNIAIWQHPEFSLPDLHVNSQATDQPSIQGAAGLEGYLVNPKGYIYFPLIGNIYVAGQTVDAIRRNITRQLKKYLRNPALNVRVAEFRSRKIYVLGEVRKPRSLSLNDQPLSITNSIMLTGGLDPNAADPTHIYVIRGTLDHPIIYWLNAKTPEAFLLAEHFYLQPNDILFVSSAAATRWNRVINQLLPTIQTVWYTRSIIENGN